MVSFRWASCQSEVSEFESMSSLLSNVFICRGEADLRIWKPDPCDVFSPKSFCRELEEISNVRSSNSLVWVGLALRVKKFCRPVASGKVSTADNLRRGLAMEDGLDICVLCSEEREVGDRLFVHCDSAHFLWCQFLERCGISSCSPSSVEEVFEVWRFVPLVGHMLVMWRLIPFSILWSVWLKRNARIFKQHLMCREDVAHLVL